MKAICNLICTKAIGLEILLILFILLNIFDFLNMLPEDIDLFKKILSWTIIGYVFYKASPTKVFIGKQIKKYDLIFIIGFSFIGISKDLIFYLINNIEANFYLFNFLIEFVKFSVYHSPNNVISTSILIGITIITLSSIFLLKNYGSSNKSFVGSIKLKDYFEFIGTRYLILIFYSLFFAFVIFNFVMEWFALAVDSIILVLGLIFYLFKYIHDKTTGKISNLIKDISNTGNDFYQKLLQQFSNKKTVFIGISFLLTLHFLVDAGVYLIPYTLGTENTLYFESLNTETREHFPIITQFQNDTKFVDDYFTLFSIIVIYISTLFLFYILLISPFYIYYKNLKNEKININKFLGGFFLTCFIFSIVLLLFYSTGESNSKNPIMFGFPENKQISGVDIYTNHITKGINASNYSSYSLEIISSTLIFLVISGFLLWKYDKYKFFFEKSIFLIIIVFMIIYLSIYYISSIENEFNSLKEILIDDEKLIINLNQKEIQYHDAIDIYNDESKYKLRNSYNIKLKNTSSSRISIIPFSNLEKATSTLVKFNKTHQDYLLIKFQTEKLTYIEFKDLNNLYLKKPTQIAENKYLKVNDEETVVYYLGENYFDLEKKRSNLYYSVRDNIYINDVILSENNFIDVIGDKANNSRKSFNTFIEILRIIFLTIFYVIGGISFIRFYIKKNF